MCGCSRSDFVISKPPLRSILSDVDVIIKGYWRVRPKDGGGSQGATIISADYYPVADKSPFSTFHQYYHFGKPFDEIEAEIVEIRPKRRRHLFTLHALLP